VPTWTAQKSMLSFFFTTQQALGNGDYLPQKKRALRYRHTLEHSSFQMYSSLFVISGFRRGVTEIFVLLGCYAA